MTTDLATAGTKNVSFMDGLDYSNKTRKYSRMISRQETHIEVWGDKNTKGYAFILQHCPKDLQAKLKNQEVWAVIDDMKSVVGLLVLIRDL